MSDTLTEPAEKPEPDLEAAPPGAAEALPQDDPVLPEDLEDDEGDGTAATPDQFAGFPMPDGVPPELAARIDALAPSFPQYVQSEQDKERWVLAARIAAGIAIDQGGDDAPDSELRQFAWGAARTLYNDPDSFPTGDPSDFQVEPDAAPDASE